MQCRSIHTASHTCDQIPSRSPGPVDHLPHTFSLSSLPRPVSARLDTSYQDIAFPQAHLRMIAFTSCPLLSIISRILSVCPLSAQWNICSSEVAFSKGTQQSSSIRMILFISHWQCSGSSCTRSTRSESRAISSVLRCNETLTKHHVFLSICPGKCAWCSCTETQKRSAAWWRRHPPHTCDLIKGK